MSNLIPALHLGGRKNEDAYTLLHHVHLSLKPGRAPVFLSDGLRSYFYTLLARYRAKIVGFGVENRDFCQNSLRDAHLDLSTISKRTTADTLSGVIRRQEQRVAVVIRGRTVWSLLFSHFLALCAADQGDYIWRNP